MIYLIIFFLLLLLREVFLGYKYGTQEPLKTKKGLQRQLYVLTIVCFISWIIFEIVVPRENSFNELTDDILDEVTNFNENLSEGTLPFYKEKFMTNEWELPITTDKKVTILKKYDGIIRFREGMYIQENEELTNTLKITILQTPLIDVNRNLIHPMNREVEVELREENDIKIVIDTNINMKDTVMVNDDMFLDDPWVFEGNSSYIQDPAMYFYIIVEVPVGTQFRELMDTPIIYLKDRNDY